MVENICTPTGPPYTLLLKKPADMDESFSNPVRQELLWRHVTAVQNQICAELRAHHWLDVYKMHIELERSRCIDPRTAKLAAPPANAHEQVSNMAIQAALDDARRLRNAGNLAFLKQDYWISAEHDAAAGRYIVRAQRYSEMALSKAFESAIEKSQVKLSWSEVINWLQYTDYKGTVSHFQIALNAADGALRMANDHAGALNLSIDALEKLVRWESLAYEGVRLSVHSFDRGGDVEVLDRTLDFGIIIGDALND